MKLTNLYPAIKSVTQDWSIILLLLAILTQSSLIVLTFQMLFTTLSPKL